MRRSKEDVNSGMYLARLSVPDQCNARLGPSAVSLPEIQRRTASRGKDVFRLGLRLQAQYAGARALGRNITARCIEVMPDAEERLYADDQVKEDTHSVLRRWTREQELVPATILLSQPGCHRACRLNAILDRRVCTQKP